MGSDLALRKTSDAPTADKPPVRAVPLEKVREATGRKLVPVPRSKVASTRAFRRMRSDRIAGLVGVAFVVMAAILIFTWPQPKVKEPPAFAVEWPEAELVAFEDPGVALAPGTPFTQAIELSQANITRVILFINWRDDVGDELSEHDNLSVRLEGPAAVNKTLEIVSSAGSDRFVNSTKDVSVVNPPELREIPAKTEGEARANIGDRSTRNGTGTWTLTMTLSYAGDDYRDNVSRLSGQPCPRAPPEGTAACRPDFGNAVEVRVSLRTFALGLKAPGT